MPLHKQLARVEIKDVDKGEIEAVFATLDVIDQDNDVTVKGAFENGAPVRISAYGHKSWEGALPTGKGTIRETKTEAILDGRFFMDTTHGRDTFLTVKEMSEGDSLQEWSYGYDVLDSERGMFKGKNVRYLKSLRVNEVSPVLLGAGIDTRTLGVKGRKQPNSELQAALRNLGRETYGDDNTYVWPEDYDTDEMWVVYSVAADGEADQLVKVGFTRDGGTVALTGEETEVERTVGYAPKSAHNKFSEHAKSVLAGVDGLITRAQEVVALRAEKGKSIAPESADLLARLDGELSRMKALLEPQPPTNYDDDLAAEYLRFVAHSQGVTT